MRFQTPVFLSALAIEHFTFKMAALRTSRIPAPDSTAAAAPFRA